MIQDTRGFGDDPSRLNALFTCLAAQERRQLFSTLRAADEPLPERALAAALRGADRDETGSASRDVGRAMQRLRHSHLPKLEAAGLIAREADAATVRPTDHPAYADEGIVEVAASTGSEDDTHPDRLFGALATQRRRTILDVLSHQFHPIHLETLARELAARELGTTEKAVPAERVERIQIDLHHAQLPQLAEADLVEYDRETGMVAYGGHPDLRVPWMHSALSPEFRERIIGDPGRELGTLDGRESVISFGQWLGERADEELFCMFTQTAMLEAGCFSRIEQAVARGVDVYLGTADPVVRDRVRNELPGVVLWEPDTDWLNLPTEGDRVGRLLMADREAVMLGTLNEPIGDAIPAEKAVVGEGADNTLVVMVQQLVNAHLEDIGAETDATNLPG